MSGKADLVEMNNVKKVDQIQHAKDANSNTRLILTGRDKKDETSNVFFHTKKDKKNEKGM